MSILYTFCPATSEDAKFLYALNRETMREHVVMTWGAWDEQFQTEFFREHFDPADNQIIQVDQKPIGRLCVLREPARQLLSEMQISVAWQRKGLGSAIVCDLLAEARRHSVPLELQVLKVNVEAQKLYRRLGFSEIRETSTHVLMRAE